MMYAMDNESYALYSRSEIITKQNKANTCLSLFALISAFINYTLCSILAGCFVHIPSLSFFLLPSVVVLFMNTPSVKENLQADKNDAPTANNYQTKEN